SYFKDLDVAAPGVCIISTDFYDGDYPAFPEDIGDGYVEGDYYSFYGTTASAPIVSGIAALVLEKDPTLTKEEVYYAIRYSADKVGGYDYSTMAPNGRCLQFGYGRVNACAALEITDELNIVEQEGNFDLKYANPVLDILTVSVYDLETFSVKMFSPTGQV